MSGSDWRPRARLEALAARSELLCNLRAFFAERGVMEVSPPVLSRRAVTAPAIESIRALAPQYDADAEMYLQTSPEYAMKRMLAAGCGPIYAITPVFRDGETGPRHNPEFTLLEWYRPGFTLDDLMREVEQLVNAVLTRGCAIHIRYQDAFLRYLGMDPLEATTEQLRQRASTLGLVNAAGCDRDGVLDFLMSSAVEPRLGDGIYFVHSYPPSQAALAEVDPGPPARARRFELFVDAVELANGYQELRDPLEQRRRFEHERELRRARGQRVPDVDERLLAALEAGLPPVSGVALGVDRLLMLKLGLDDIRDTLAFALDDA